MIGELAHGRELQGQRLLVVGGGASKSALTSCLICHANLFFLFSRFYQQARRKLAT
jgi:hypothetical protein